MHFICIYLLALLHIFEYTKKTELYPAIGKEELFQMLYSKNKKRGFTLVELIVVLVILAILAALLIPALTGYIDKAKKDQVIAETRMLHEAIQTEMVELYGSNTNWKPANKAASTIASATNQAIHGSTLLPNAQQRYNEIVKLSKLKSLQPNGKGSFCAFITSNAKIHALIYNSGTGYIGVYFRDTQQYTVYKIGEKTDTNMGSISDANIANYYGYVYYNYVYDAQINSTTGKYDSPEEYFWSCDAIRSMLGITEYSQNFDQ